MLLSWDLTPNDSDGMAYLLPRRLGTMKASLRFAKPLPTMMTLLAYAQCDNLVVVDDGAPCAILVMFELAALDALEWDIGRVEALLNEHNTRTHAGPAQLLFHQLSTLDSGQLRHSEVSRWQGFVRASVRRFFINLQGDLYTTKEGIQYNADQLAILRQLFPLIRRDFSMAARKADQMADHEQETMDLILAHECELLVEEVRQRDPGFKARMRSIAMWLGLPPPGTDMLRPHHQQHPGRPPPLVVARTLSPSRLLPLRKEHPCPS